MEINIKKGRRNFTSISMPGALLLSVVYQHSPVIYKQFYRGEAQASRLLYIMLAFFEHFNETKALSIIRAF